MPDIAYMPNAASCGTSTAVSVPCLFSHRGRDAFRLRDSAAETNLLDMLQRAGITVEWHDNNSGCKGVCARVRTLDYFARRSVALATAGIDLVEAKAACAGPHCLDEILSRGLARRLTEVSSDTVIVLHQIGSHGPAYHERYPEADEFFKPACRSNRLDACSTQEVVNAYDNSIRYTDRVLASQIRLLQAAGDRVDAALLYVSDHGESLGEGGLFLHGMPYAFAPRVQKEVPMLLWLSPGWQKRHHTAMDCVRATTSGAPAGHDVVFHTVFGLMDVRNHVYRGDRDLTAPCRGAFASPSVAHVAPRLP